ncbi:MAG: DUF2341 domain-containing protein [Candidatus Komeilibacteria bacterium]
MVKLKTSVSTTEHYLPMKLNYYMIKGVKLNKINPRRWQPPALIIITAIIIVIGLIYIFNKPEPATAWFNDGWHYRQTVAVTNAGTEQTDFQIKITLDTAALVTAGKMQSDCDDIRLTDINGNVLSHWIEDTTCNTAATEIWTKLASIPTTAINLYLYYGNPSVNSVEVGQCDMFVCCGSDVGGSYHNNPGYGLTYNTTEDYTLQFVTLDSEIAQDIDVYVHDGPAPTDTILYTKSISLSSGLNTDVNIEIPLGIGTNYLLRPDNTRDNLKRTPDDSNLPYVCEGITINGGNQGYSTYYYYFYNWKLRKHTTTEPVVGDPSSEEKGPGPIAYWKFDEGYGITAQDSTTGNNDGTITGATWQAEDMCVSGKCLSFNGSSYFVKVSDNSILKPTDVITVGAWFNSNDITTSGQRIVSKTEGSGYQLSLNENSACPTNTLCFLAHVAGGYRSASYASSNIESNKWYYLVGTFDGTNGYLYLNGEQVGSFSQSGTIATSTAPVCLGAEATSTSCSTGYFNGRMDGVGIYNYARTAAQIKADYLAGQSGAPSGASASLGSRQQDQSEGLVGYWKMDDAGVDAEGETISDSSGNGNSGTLYGDNATGDNGTGMDCTASGKYGTGCSFDGVDDYVSIIDNGDLDLETAWTVATWVKREGTCDSGGYSKIVSKWENYFLAIDCNLGDNVLYGCVGDGSGHTCNNSRDTTLPLNEWHFLTFTYSEALGKADLYMDTQLIHSVDATSTASSNYDLNFGTPHSGVTNQYFQGKIDNVKIYNTARTAEQIMRDYKTGPPPVAYYDFEEKSTSIAYDKSTYGYNLTAVGLDSTNIVLGKIGSAYKYGTWTERHTGSSFNICNNITMEAWVYPLSTPSNMYTIVLNNGANAAYLSYDPSNGVSTYWYNKSSVGYHSSGSSTVPLNTWSHVAAVWDNTGANLYVNGILKNFVSSTGTSSCTGDGLVVGAENDVRQMDGYIDEVKIYNYARTPEQILQDMYGDEDAHPIAYYKFDEGYGTSLKDSINNNDLTNSGADWTPNGRFNKALSFNGSSDYLTRNIFSDDWTNSSSGSISMWFNWDSTDTDGVAGLLAIQDTSTNNNLFRLSLGNTTGSWDDESIRVEFYDNSIWVYNYVYRGGEVLYRDSQWHNVVFTINENGNNLYVDGEKLSVSQWGSSLEGQSSTRWLDDIPEVNNIFVGSTYSSGAPYINIKGKIDELKIFNFALSPEQIRKEYNQSAGLQIRTQKNDSSTWDDGGFGGAAPIAYWDFEEGSGSTAYDKSGNGYNGSIVGAAYDLGKNGWGLDFNGTSDYVSTGFTGSFADMTQEFWIYLPSDFDNTVRNEVIGVDWTAGDRATHFAIGWDSTANTHWNTGNDWTNIPNDNLKTGWNHVALVMDSSSSKKIVYFNGAVALSNSNYSAINISTDLQIGYLRDYAGSYLEYPLDEMKIFNYARTPAQIAYDYNGGKPIGWWKFDDGEGITANDASGNGNNGTLTNMDPATDWLESSNCQFNGCLDFDGTDDRIIINESSVLKLTKAVSIAVWVKPSAMGVNHWGLVSQGDAFGESYSLYIRYNTNNMIRMVINNNGSTAGNLDIGQWNHIVGTFDVTDGIKLYKNGELITTTAYSSDIVPVAEGLYIGWQSGLSGSDYFQGNMDDVRIYNYALTADQVKEVMNYGLIRFK